MRRHATIAAVLFFTAVLGCHKKDEKSGDKAGDDLGDKIAKAADEAKAEGKKEAQKAEAKGKEAEAEAKAKAAEDEAKAKAAEAEAKAKAVEAEAQAKAKAEAKDDGKVADKEGGATKVKTLSPVAVGLRPVFLQVLPRVAGAAPPPIAPPARTSGDSSALLREKLLVALNIPEFERLCDWGASVFGGYGAAITCEKRTTSTYKTRKECMSMFGSLTSKCAAKVGDFEDCLNTMKRSACSNVIFPPACGPMLACMVGG